MPRVKYATDYRSKHCFSMSYASRKVIFPGGIIGGFMSNMIISCGEPFVWHVSINTYCSVAYGKLYIYRPLVFKIDRFIQVSS